MVKSKAYPPAYSIFFFFWFCCCCHVTLTATFFSIYTWPNQRETQGKVWFPLCLQHHSLYVGRGMGEMNLDESGGQKWERQNCWSAWVICWQSAWLVGETERSAMPHSSWSASFLIVITFWTAADAIEGIFHSSESQQDFDFCVLGTHLGTVTNSLADKAKEWLSS